MKSLYMVSLLACFVVCDIVQAKMSDKEIAREAVAHASVLLSADIESEEGDRFLKLSTALEPDADSLLLLNGYLKRGNTPKALPTGLEKDAFLKEVKGRGLYLLKEHFKSCSEVGSLSLLYLRFCDVIGGSNGDILSGLAYLQSYGVEGELDELLDQEWDIASIYKSRNKPSKVAGAKLPETDTKVAKEAIKIASQLLAEDPASIGGVTLLRMAHHMIPSDSNALLLLMQLQRSLTITKARSKMSASQLAAYLVKRGASYLKTAETKEFSAHLAMLYFRTAEVFDAENQKVLLGLMKMEKLDRTEQFDDLVEVDLIDLVPQPESRSLTASRNAPTPRYGLGNPQVGTPPADKGPFDPQKLKIKVWKRKNNERRGGGDFDDEVQNLDVIATIENWTKVDLKGYKVALHIIGQSVTNKKNLEVLKIFTMDLDLPCKAQKKFEKHVRIEFDDRNSAQSGHYFYGHVFFLYAPGEVGKKTNGERRRILRDGRIVRTEGIPEFGTPIRVEGYPSALEKYSEKIKKYSIGTNFDSRRCDAMN
ncbi:hypothetical protein BVY04_02945 [bacterium M21]|nr:hypothetical protein BVY04_02945 [bacterium M21]